MHLIKITTICHIVSKTSLERWLISVFYHRILPEWKNVPFDGIILLLTMLSSFQWFSPYKATMKHIFNSQNDSLLILLACSSYFVTWLTWDSMHNLYTNWNFSCNFMNALKKNTEEKKWIVQFRSNFNSKNSDEMLCNIQLKI